MGTGLFAAGILNFWNTMGDQILLQATKNNWPRNIIDEIIIASKAIGRAYALAVGLANSENPKPLIP